MVEIDLFYNKAAAAIRERQAAYLRAKRALPFKQELPPVNELSADEYARLKPLQRWLYRRELKRQKRAYRKALRAQKRPVDEQLTLGYNAGIEAALRILESEYGAFSKQLKKDKESI